MSDYPHLFDNIGSITRTTQMYTQRRSSVESPGNYKFTVEELADFLIQEFELITKDKMYYLHIQTTPATIWNVPHNLDRPVQVRCWDQDDINIIGEPSNDSINSTSIGFTVAVNGAALCT